MLDKYLLTCSARQEMEDVLPRGWSERPPTSRYSLISKKLCQKFGYATGQLIRPRCLLAQPSSPMRSEGNPQAGLSPSRPGGSCDSASKGHTRLGAGRRGELRLN